MPAKSAAERAPETAAPKADFIDATALIALVPMRPYDAIGEFGCGQGHLTIPLARYAHSGRIYAIDSGQKALDTLQERAQQAHLSNIETVLSKESSVPLDDGKLDGAVVADMLCDANRPKSVLKEVHRLLRKGGWLAVIAWAKTEGKQNGTGPAPRKSPDEVLELAAETGFRKLSARPLNGERYLLVLRK